MSINHFESTKHRTAVFETSTPHTSLVYTYINPSPKTTPMSKTLCFLMICKDCGKIRVHCITISIRPLAYTKNIMIVLIYNTNRPPSCWSVAVELKKFSNISVHSSKWYRNLTAQKSLLVLCSPLHLSEVSPMLRLKQFPRWSIWRWPCLILSR